MSSERWGHNGIAARTIDDRLVRVLGLPYLRLTRERAIHERCRYGLAAMDQLGLVRPAVLDVGCGSGIMMRYLATYTNEVASYTGIDLSASRLGSRYRGGSVPARFIDVDLDSDWHFPGNDLAWCSEVLEHLFDDVGVLYRIAEAVKPGGYVIVTVPSLPFIEGVAEDIPSMRYVSQTQDGGHVRAGYTAESLITLAARAGLETVRVDAVSPRTPGDLRIRTRFISKPVIFQTIESLSIGSDPAHVFRAGIEALAHYCSIAAVLRKP